MKYFKITLSVLALWIAHFAYGQEFFNGGFYVRANMSTPNYEFIDYDKRFGGDIGFAAETGCKWCYVEYGLGYTNIGMKYKCELDLHDANSLEYRENHKIKYKGIGHYIDIPLAIAFRLANKEGFGISISGGGYMDIGIAGKIKIKDSFSVFSYQAKEYSEDWKYDTKLFGDESYQYKRFDAGWKVGANIHLGPVVRIGAEYRQGAINLSRLEGTKFTNKVFNLSLIFMISNSYED